MHQAGRARLPGKVVVLGHRQGVHVGSQPNHLAALALPPVDERDYASLADAGVNLVGTAMSEGLDHAACGVDLFKTQFRMGVQIASQRRDLAMKLRNVRVCTALHLKCRRKCRRKPRHQNRS